jgi:hypothetical protein
MTMRGAVCHTITLASRAVPIMIQLLPQVVLTALRPTQLTGGNILVSGSSPL